MRMTKVIFILRLLQVIPTIVMLLIAVATIYKLSNTPVNVLSTEEIHSWISKGTKAQAEQYFIVYQEALVGLKDTLLLLAKWIRFLAVQVLSLTILECLIKIVATNGRRDANQKQK